MIQIPEWLPLFPLPNVVFFPKTYLPLHVFEPRYCQMIEESLASDRVIGMVLLKEGWEDQYEGNPPIDDLGTVGRIVRSQPLDDGTFDIILYGLKKFRVEGENFERPYRQGRIELLPEPPSGPIPPAMREALIELVARYHQKGGEALRSVLEIGLDDDALIATLSFGLPFTVLEKQFLLEAEDLLQQGKRLIDLMRLGLQAIGRPGETK